ncbi:MAG: hypothetical protein IPN73_00170 [Saprospiraceae bacterium]|nr:hypothetical protein [Saprospiraceae bacterium]
MAPKDGKALMFLQLEEAKTLDAADDFVTRNKIAVEDKANVNVNGLPAIALYGTQVPDPAVGGETLKLMTYLIQYNNQIYKMVGLVSTPILVSISITFRPPCAVSTS